MTKKGSATACGYPVSIQWGILRSDRVLQWESTCVPPSLPAGIEDLCSKRDELHKQILQEEEEKQKIQNDLRILTERISQVNESLARKIAMRNDYDKTIAETENAYKKVRVGGVAVEGSLDSAIIESWIPPFLVQWQECLNWKT